MAIIDKIQKLFHLEEFDSEVLFDKTGILHHMRKRHHKDAIPYLDFVEEIIERPDFVGKTEKNGLPALEFIRVYEDNVLVAVKLNEKKRKFYVASVYIITDSKVRNRVESGRIIKLDTDRDG